MQCSPLGWKVAPQSDWDVPEAVEDGLSFIENALIKARHASKHTGLPALGDDSGLVVDALQGAPGIYSAGMPASAQRTMRITRKLLSEAEGMPSARSAHFYCAMALVRMRTTPRR